MTAARIALRWLTITWVAALLIVCAAGCGPATGLDAGLPDAAPELDAALTPDGGLTSDAAPVSDAALDLDGGVPLPPSCTPETVEGCAYGPAAPLAQLPTRTEVLSYTDATGATRTIEVAIRQPDGAAGPLPLVVWSHGGADGMASAGGVGASWSRVFTGAGYVFIGIAHRGRDASARMALCQHLGYDADACMRFKFLSWDRPHDLREVLDRLETTGWLEGLIDPSRIAYAGHSAGAGSVMMVAGASRDFAGTLLTLPDPRPIAFLACSPQGPGEDGFVEGSFDAIARPVLTLSSAGDDTSDTVAEDRREPFMRMMPGEKYLGWIADESARHTTNNLETDACIRYARDNGLDEARCELFTMWHASAALAFFDAQLRNDPRARAYLASDSLEILSEATMEWSRR